MNKKTPIAGRLGFVICYKDGTGSVDGADACLIDVPEDLWGAP